MRERGFGLSRGKGGIVINRDGEVVDSLKF